MPIYLYYFLCQLNCVNIGSDYVLSVISTIINQIYPGAEKVAFGGTGVLLDLSRGECT